MDVRMKTRMADCMIGAGALTAAVAGTAAVVVIGLGSVPGTGLMAALLVGLVLAVPGILARIDHQGDLSSHAALQHLHRARQHRAESPAQPVVLG